MMSREFEMSMIGELSFFLGLQIKQLKEGTFVCQSKYVKDILKKFGMEDAKPIKTPMDTNGHLDLDEGGKSVDLKIYRSMLVVCFILPHLGPISCLVYAYVLDFKPHLKSVI
jgi:hypothetical protein